MHNAVEKGQAKTTCVANCPFLVSIIVRTDAFILLTNKKQTGSSCMAEGVRP